MRPLIVRLPNWIGDVVMSLPTLWHLHNRGYALQLVGKGWAGALLAGCGWPVHKLPGGLRERVRLLRGLAKAARADDDGFDKRLNMLLLTNSLSSALEARLAGLKSAGYRQDGRGWLLAHAHPQPDGVIHESQRFLALAGVLAPGGVPPMHELPQPHLPVGDGAREAARRLLQQHGLLALPVPGPDAGNASTAGAEGAASAASGVSSAVSGVSAASADAGGTGGALAAARVRPYVCLVPFATGTLKGVSKAWPGFQMLSRELAQQQVPVVMAPGPGVERQQAHLGFPGAIVLEDVGLDVYAALLADSALVVANDTGPGHMAGAVGARLLSVLGPTDVRRYGALGPRVQWLQRSPWPEAGQVLVQVNRMMAH